MRSMLGSIGILVLGLAPLCAAGAADSGFTSEMVRVTGTTEQLYRTKKLDPAWVKVGPGLRRNRSEFSGPMSWVKLVVQGQHGNTVLETDFKPEDAERRIWVVYWWMGEPRFKDGTFYTLHQMAVDTDGYAIAAMAEGQEQLTDQDLGLGEPGAEPGLDFIARLYFDRKTPNTNAGTDWGRKALKSGQPLPGRP